MSLHILDRIVCRGYQNMIEPGLGSMVNDPSASITVDQTWKGRGLEWKSLAPGVKFVEIERMCWMEISRRCKPEL